MFNRVDPCSVSSRSQRLSVSALLLGTDKIARHESTRRPSVSRGFARQPLHLRHPQHRRPRRRRSRPPGTKVQYLNIGDPIAFGFETPPHLIAAVERAMRDGHNGYVAVARHPAGARSGRRRIHVARPADVTADRVLHHGGHVRRHRAGAERARERRRRSAGPVADLSAVHGGAGEDRRHARVYYRTDPAHGWLPDLDHLRAPGHADERGRWS